MSPDLIHLIESNGLTLHGDIEHFAHLVEEATAAKYARALAVLARAHDAIEALDGTSVENERLVDDYRAVMAGVAHE